MTAAGQPLVSVAIATCEGAEHLRAQLDSIYAQTWRNLEVVATDDASTDGTAAILAEYAERHGLRYEVNPRRLGLVKNFERAISLCRGEYVALSDQDDVWKPHKVETLVGRLGGSTLIYGNTQETISPAGEILIDASHEWILRFARAHGTGRPTRHLLAENWVVGHTLLFRRELAAHALPIPPHQPFHDGWLALVASKLGGIRYLDERLQIYRQHPKSLTWVDPALRPPLRRPFPELLSRFRADWRRKCEVEIARLTDVLLLPLLDEADRAFVGELLAYYRTGLHRGPHWGALRRGLALAPFFSTQREPGGVLRFALRGFVGGRQEPAVSGAGEAVPDGR